MKRFFFILTAFIIITSGASFAKSYKIAVVPWIGWSPVHVAEAKGFWKELGVEVQVFTVSSGQQIRELLQNKTIDIAFDMIGNCVGFYMEGRPVVVIAETDWSHGGDKIIVKQGTAPVDIMGKPVGVYEKALAVTFFFNQYLNSAGIALSDVNLIEMDVADLTENFIAGRFQTIVAYDPEALKAEREGSGQVIATSATYEGCIPEGMFMLAEVFQAIPERDLSKIFKGWLLAVQWINQKENWNEYVRILNEKTFPHDSSFSEDDIREMATAVKIHNPTELFNRNKEEGGLYQYLKELHTFLETNQMLSKDFAPADIFKNYAIMKSMRISSRVIEPPVIIEKGAVDKK